MLAESQDSACSHELDCTSPTAPCLGPWFKTPNAFILQPVMMHCPPPAHGRKGGRLWRVQTRVHHGWRASLTTRRSGARGSGTMPPPRAARLMRTSRALWGAQLGGGGASRPWVWAAASRGLPSDERRPGARGACLGARAAGWYGLMPAAPLLGRLSKPRTVHRERIGAIEQGGNSRGCEAPLCVPFLLLVCGIAASAAPVPILQYCQLAS